MVEISQQVPRVLAIAGRLSQIDLGVTVRSASDTFREQICSVLIEWLTDLAKCTIYGTDGVLLRKLIAARLFLPRGKPPSYAAAARLPSSSTSGPTRIEWLIFYHTRLWKRPRLNLKDLYILIMNIDHTHKLDIGKSNGPFPRYFP